MASAPTNYRNMGRGGRNGSPYGVRSGSASPQRGPSPNHLQQPRGGPSSTPTPRTLGSRPSDLNLKLAASRGQSSAGSNLVPSPRANKRGGGSSVAAGGGTASRTTSMNHGGLSMFDSPSHRADGKSQAESGGALTPTTSVKVGTSTPYSTPGTTRLHPSNSLLGPARRDKRETTKCGWLEKFAVGRGMMGFKNWQRRYFTVNSNGLNYSKGEKSSGAARTYIPFTTQKSPEVKLAPVFLLHSISPNLHPEAHDAGNKYYYFGIRFEENKKSFLLLLRTVDSSTRERWVRFLAQILPWGVQYNLGVPPSHPQDPTLQRLYDPEDLDEKERKALRKTVLEWDEGYQEFRYRKIVLKALASAAAVSTTTSMRSIGGGGDNSSVSRLPSSIDSPTRNSGSPKISRAVSMGSGGNQDSRANSSLSNPLMNGSGNGRNEPLPHLGSGKSIGSAFQLGGDVTDPDSPYFTGITYIGGVSSLSAPTPNGSMPSAPSSSSYLARCFGFGGPQQGWEMQDGDKEDDDDDDVVEDVDYTAYGPTGERLVDDDAPPSDDTDGGGLARLGSSDEPLPGGGVGGGADSLGTSGDGNVDELPSGTTKRTASSSRGASHQGNGHSAPVTPLDTSNPAFPSHSPSQHHNPQRRVSSHNVQHHHTHHHYVGGSTPRKSGLETVNDSTTSTTMDYDEQTHNFRSDGGVNSPLHVDVESPDAIARRTPTSASTSRQYDPRTRGMTAVVRPSGAYERQQGLENGSPQQPYRSRADSSILVDNSSSTTRNTSFMRDPRRRPTLGPEL